jgi:transcription initiation factor IIF auxiliary subunit
MSLKLRNSWEYKGNDWWAWEAFLDDGGSGELTKVESVEYVLHPTFPKPVVTITDPKNGFVLRTSGWGTFNLTAFVNMKNGKRQKLTHLLELELEPTSGKSP